jgi:uncharacterized membrane protein
MTHKEGGVAERIWRVRNRRIRNRMVSGLVALVPVMVTVFALRFIFTFTAGILLPVVDPALANWPWIVKATISLLILLLCVYILGTIATNIVGRRILGLGEALLLRVPFVKVVYGISKQVVNAFQGSGVRAFQSVVFVSFPHTGMQALAFVTSSIIRADGSVWNTVFVPTTPNPTTGFLQVVPASEVMATDFSVEEGIKMIMSLGVLVPERMALLP